MMNDYDGTGESARLNSISQIYHSEDLAGANEQYHVYLRNAVLPDGGGRSALEIGCGKGLWSCKLADLYDRLDVVDGSSELVSSVYEANKHKAALKVHCTLIEDFFDATADLWQHIYMTFLLEHVEDPVSLLKRAHDHLEVGGVLFVAVPNANSVHRVLALRAGLIKSTDELSRYDKLVGHRRVYSAELLQHQLLQAGFHKIEMKPVGLKPLALHQLNGLPPSVIEALCASADLAPDNSAYLTLRAYKS